MTVAEELIILEEGKVGLQMISPIPPGRTVTVDVACPGEMMAWSSLAAPTYMTLPLYVCKGAKVLALDAGRLRLILRDDNTNTKIIERSDPLCDIKIK